LDNSIIINAAVKLMSVIGTMLFTPVSVIGPVSSLAFWTAILDTFALSAQHRFLMFVTLLAAIATSHFCLSFQSVILSFKQVQPFRLWKNDIISRSQSSHKSLVFECRRRREPPDPVLNT
jgi:flagellar biosynthesis protein FlhB